MSWWGKLIGGSIGFMLGGPIGAMLGAYFGHSIDRTKISFNGSRVGSQHEQTQMAFFTATFAVMGHVAKADGQVTRDEISMAKAVMQQMRLNDEMKKMAMHLFGEGKKVTFKLDDVLEQFKHECHRQRTLIRVFIEIQLQAAFADGELHQNERELLLIISGKLGFSKAEFEQLVSLIEAGMYHQNQGAGKRSPSANELAIAYKVLCVSQNSSDQEIKRSYRKLMSQHHPDKLVAKGLPEEMIKIATNKTHEIRKSYEIIKENRMF